MCCSGYYHVFRYRLFLSMLPGSAIYSHHDCDLDRDGSFMNVLHQCKSILSEISIISSYLRFESWWHVTLSIIMLDVLPIHANRVHYKPGYKPLSLFLTHTLQTYCIHFHVSWGMPTDMTIFLTTWIILTGFYMPDHRHLICQRDHPTAGPIKQVGIIHAWLLLPWFSYFICCYNLV